MKSIRCCVCGIAFGIEPARYDKLLETGEDFFCPNGHRQHFTESVQSKLKKAHQKISSLQRHADWLTDQLREASEARRHAQARIRGFESARARARRRAREAAP